MDGHAWLEKRNGLLIDSENSLIDSLLPRGELAVHGHGAGAVAGVVGVLRAEIHQQQVAILHLLVVLDIVKDTGVGTGSDNGRERMGGRAVAYHLVGHLGLDLVLVFPGFDGGQRPAEHLAGNLAGLLHRLQFLGALDVAQRVEDRGEATVVVQRIVSLHPLGKADLASGQFLPEARVFGNVEIDVLRLHHHGVEDALELLVEIDVLDAGNRGGVSFGEPMAEPDDLLGRRVLDEEGFAVGGVRVPRGEQQGGLLLVNAAEIEQLGILPEGVRGVAAARVLVVRDKQCDSVFRHLADHIAAIAGIKFS